MNPYYHFYSLMNIYDLFPSVGTLTGEIIGAMIFLLLYETLYRRTVNYLKVRHLNGTYNHIDHMGELCETGKNLVNYSEITIKWSNPTLMDIVSHDYSNPAIIWKGTYGIDPSLTYAFGYWKYDNNREVGNHVLHFLNKDEILVQAMTHNQIPFIYYFKRKPNAFTTVPVVA